MTGFNAYSFVINELDASVLELQTAQNNDSISLNQEKEIESLIGENQKKSNEYKRLREDYTGRPWLIGKGDEFTNFSKFIYSAKVTSPRIVEIETKTVKLKKKKQSYNGLFGKEYSPEFFSIELESDLSPSEYNYE